MFRGCVFFVCCYGAFFLIGKKINANAKEVDRKDKGRENSIAIKRIALHTKTKALKNVKVTLIETTLCKQSAIPVSFINLGNIHIESI